MVRLGAGGLDGRALTPAAMAGGLEALSKFRRLADSHKVDEIIAAATSATREAENGGDFLATVRDRTGIDVRVISGAEEARLIHIAATYGIDLAKRHGVVIDIGGGSVEITLGAAREPALAKSFKVGVIRLTERFVRGDPIARRDERRLVEHIEKAIGAARRPDRRTRLPARHRHVGNDPQPRVCRAGRRERPRRRRPAPPARVGQVHPQDSQGAGRLRSGRASADGGARSAARRPGGGRRRAARHHPPPPRRRRDLAVRDGPARRADPRLRPAQRAPHRRRRALSGHPPPQRRGARRTLPLLVRACASGGADGHAAVRSDGRRATASGRGNASG